MSTTFWVRTNDFDKTIEEVAFRSNEIYFINNIAHLLPDDTKVIPMDNTAQWIYTIGDIKKAILDNKEEINF